MSRPDHYLNPNNESYAFSSDDDEGGVYMNQYTPGKSPKRNSKLSRTPGASKYTNARHSMTVSLSDFERDYLPTSTPSAKKGHTDQSRSALERSHKSPSGILGHLVACRRWLEGTSRWRIALTGCVLGLLCAVIYQSGLHLGALKRGKDNLLPCPSIEPCLDPPQLTPALLLAEAMRDHLHNRAGQFDCGVKSVTSRNMTLEELSQLLPEEYRHNNPVVKHAMYLVLRNPQWGIRWFDRHGNNVTSLSSPLLSDVLDSTQPRHTWRCYASLIFISLWDRIRIALIVLIAALVLATVVRWYLVKREQEKRSVYLMVDRILDLLKKHYNTCNQERDLLPYLAIIHVRDTLIPPSERKLKKDIWTKACEWISTHESRVRVENRRIAGEDFLVWRWIQEDPPKTEEPSLVASEPGTSPVVKNDRQKGKEWSPWTAIDHYGPRVGERVAPAIGTPSPFIRLKNMFDTIRMDDEQAKQIENSVLDRCMPHGAVVHIYVDKKSAFGCVYLKMDSLQSATKAYRALHGGWYNGKLVTAKYIEASRYNKWFPHAANATQQLMPS